MSYLTAWDSTWAEQWLAGCSPTWPCPGSTPKQCSWSVKGTKAMPRELQTPQYLAHWPEVPGSPSPEPSGTVSERGYNMASP